jgi:hypothetical protein
MCNSQNTVRQGLARKVKSWFKRPATLKVAAFILNVVSVVIKIYDHFN